MYCPCTPFTLLHSAQDHNYPTHTINTLTDNFWAEICGFLQSCGCSGWCSSGDTTGASHCFRSVWSRQEHPDTTSWSWGALEPSEPRGCEKDCFGGKMRSCHSAAGVFTKDIKLGRRGINLGFNNFPASLLPPPVAWYMVDAWYLVDASTRQLIIISQITTDNLYQSKDVKSRLYPSANRVQYRWFLSSSSPPLPPSQPRPPV